MKRAAIVGVAAVGAVVIAGAGVAWWALSRGQAPQDAARAYLDALADGDLETIQAMRDPLPEAQEQTLEDAFLSAAGYLSDPSIEDVRERGDGTAEVHASADFDGERHELRFALEEEAGRWRLVGDHVGSLTADAAIEGGTPLDWVAVGEAPAPSATAISLLPARYVVAAAPRGILEGSVRVAIADDPVAVSIEASVDAGAAERMQQQIDVYADDCARPAATVADHCGIVVPWAADLAALERISFRIEKYPALTLSTDARSFDATGGALVATAVGTTHDGSAGSFTYRSDDWALRGTVALEADRAVLSVR